MAKRISLTAAEEQALQSLDFHFADGIDRFTMASLDQRGLIRNRTGSLGENYWELTTFGKEVLAAIEEPLVGYGEKVW